MTAVAVEYEHRNSGKFSIDGFESFLASSSKREQGTSSNVVRILTIHRSKGLTFDRVFVPIAENSKKSIAECRDGALLHTAGEDWVLSGISEDVASLDPGTCKAWNEAADEVLLSNIRTYYVALTRARKSLCVLIPLSKPVPGKPFFRDVIVSAFADFKRRKTDNGCEVVFEQGVEPEFAPFAGVEEKAGAQENPLWLHDAPAERVERFSPSSSGGRDFAASGLQAAGFFSESAGEAAKKGLEIHGKYESIEWLGEEGLAALPQGFREAFMKPVSGAALWRERPYEIYRPRKGGGEWESGRFDRVVFSGEGDGRKASVYDFKTNALKPGETVEAFEMRMRMAYGSQMEAYRAAVEALTGIPSCRIRTVLLLDSTGTSVECGI